MIDFHDSTNVIYGIRCVQCGLVYVGETGRSLRSRMNGHRSAIKKGGQSLLHRHFHQPDHSVDDMRLQIFEKKEKSYLTLARPVTWWCTAGNPPLEVAPGHGEIYVNSYRRQTMHQGNQLHWGE